MQRLRLSRGIVVTLVLSLSLFGISAIGGWIDGGLVPAQVFAGNWPQWRGPLGTGISDEKNVPLNWSATKNVKWKVELPAEGRKVIARRSWLEAESF